MPPTFNSLLFAHALQQSVKARLLLSVGCRYCLLIATHANHNEALNNRSNEHRHCFIGVACAFVEATQQRLFGRARTVARAGLGAALVRAPVTKSLDEQEFAWATIKIK